MLKMSFIIFNAHFDTSHHGTPHPFKDAGIDANILTGIHNAIMKCPFVATGTVYTMVLRYPQG
jgi:hypothetical protein